MAQIYILWPLFYCLGVACLAVAAVLFIRFRLLGAYPGWRITLLVSVGVALVAWLGIFLGLVFIAQKVGSL